MSFHAALEFNSPLLVRIQKVPSPHTPKCRIEHPVQCVDNSVLTCHHQALYRPRVRILLWLLYGYGGVESTAQLVSVLDSAAANVSCIIHLPKDELGVRSNN